MSEGYERPPGAKQYDHANSKIFEDEVYQVLVDKLGIYGVFNETRSTTKLDFFSPGFWLEVKEKNQRLGDRWLDAWPSVPEQDLFVLDELGTRKICAHWPHSYVILRDNPQGRTFWAGCFELAVVPRARLQRKGKGKLLFDTRHFRPLADLDAIVELIREDMATLPWTNSECLGALETPQV